MSIDHVMSSSQTRSIQNPKQKEPEYHLFRTYQTSGERNEYFRPGPDPKTCKVWEAIAATGAAKYFLEPYRIGSTIHSDDKVPTPHPVSCLALKEAMHILGERPPISIIVNIGPGIPNHADVKDLEHM